MIMKIIVLESLEGPSWFGAVISLLLLRKIPNKYPFLFGLHNVDIV
jgi:hypothetical protein